VTRDEPHLDYVPTQIPAEAFRSRGFHGIIYKSLLDKAGKNIALFDPEAALLTTVCLYEARSASLDCGRVEPDHSRTNWPESISSHFEPAAFVDGIDSKEV